MNLPFQRQHAFVFTDVNLLRERVGSTKFERSIVLIDTSKPWTTAPQSIVRNCKSVLWKWREFTGNCCNRLRLPEGSSKGFRNKFSRSVHHNGVSYNCCNISVTTGDYCEWKLGIRLLKTRLEGIQPLDLNKRSKRVHSPVKLTHSPMTDKIFTDFPHTIFFDR